MPKKRGGEMFTSIQAKKDDSKGVGQSDHFIISYLEETVIKCTVDPDLLPAYATISFTRSIGKLL